MINLFSYLYAMKNHRAIRFIIYELLISLLFALAYWITSIFISKYSQPSNQYNFDNSNKIDSFMSYLHFALVTQTTVGYGGVLPDGGNILTTKSRPLRLLVMTQLISIILLTGWTML